jgi:Lrp/AsnC family transcriptional regulator, leucine-responsive regulatory protein
MADAITGGLKGALEGMLRVASQKRYSVIYLALVAETCKIMKQSSIPPELDRIDLKMLRLLQADGRLSNAELAQMVRVSPATCHRRTRRLFEEGYIARVRAMVAPGKVERGALVMVGVVLDRSTPESFAAFEKAVAKLNFILDCHLVAGDFDYFLKIRVRDMADFNRIHGEQLIALPGVRQTRTFFVMKEVVDNAPLDF